MLSTKPDELSSQDPTKRKEGVGGRSARVLHRHTEYLKKRASENISEAGVWGNGGLEPD